MPLHELALDPTVATDDAPALITPEVTWSRGDLRAAVDAMGHAIRTLAPEGGRIALAADNRPEVVALLLAIPAARRVAVPLNIRLTPEDMAVILERTGTRALVGVEEELARLDPALALAPSVQTTVGLDPGAGDITLDTLVAAPTSTTEDPPPPPGPDDPAWLIATSGTTGRAKVAILTAGSLRAAVASAAAARALADDEVYLYPFPLYHVSAYNVLHALSRGRPVVLPPRFDPRAITSLAARHHVTAMSLAPTMLRALLDHRAATPEPEALLSDLRTIAYGAAPMPPALLAEASDALGVGFAQGYGMTELSGNAVFLSPDDHRRGLDGDERLLRAAGWPGPGVEVMIAGDDGRAVAAGDRGEICMRGAQVCAGYWDDPAAEADGWRDGWLRTGDVGVVAPDGLLTIVDRAKDIIVTGGENVASREVEDVIGAHPLVARVAVVGVADDRWGESICAVIVVRAGADHDPSLLRNEVLARARAGLAGFKVPKRIVFADDLPVNSAGKVVKAELRRRVADRSDLEDER